MAKNKKKKRNKAKAKQPAKAPQGDAPVEVSASSDGAVAPSEAALQVKESPPTTRSLRVPSPPPPAGLMARLFTTGHTDPSMIWTVWFIDLLAAVAWNLACLPFVNRLVQGQSASGIKLMDVVISLIGALLVLRVVTLLSDLKRTA